VDRSFPGAGSGVKIAGQAPAQEEATPPAATDKEDAATGQEEAAAGKEDAEMTAAEPVAAAAKDDDYDDDDDDDDDEVRLLLQSLRCCWWPGHTLIQYNNHSVQDVLSYHSQSHTHENMCPLLDRGKALTSLLLAGLSLDSMLCALVMRTAEPHTSALPSASLHRCSWRGIWLQH